MTGTTRFRAALIAGLIGLLFFLSSALYELVTGLCNVVVTMGILVGQTLVVPFWLVVLGFLAVRGFRRWLTRRGNR